MHWVYKHAVVIVITTITIPTFRWRKYKETERVGSRKDLEESGKFVVCCSYFDFGLFIALECVKSQNQLPFHTIKSSRILKYENHNSIWVGGYHTCPTHIWNLSCIWLKTLHWLCKWQQIRIMPWSSFYFKYHGDIYVQVPYYCICQTRGCNGNDPLRSYKNHHYNIYSFINFIIVFKKLSYISPCMKGPGLKGLCAERHNNAITQRQGPTVWFCPISTLWTELSNFRRCIASLRVYTCQQFSLIILVTVSTNENWRAKHNLFAHDDGSAGNYLAPSFFATIFVALTLILQWIRILILHLFILSEISKAHCVILMIANRDRFCCTLS